MARPMADARPRPTDWKEWLRQEALRVRHAQEARHPAAEMAGVRGDGALLRQDRIDRLAQRARIDEAGGRRVLIGRVVVVAVVDALARTVVAPSRARADGAPVQLGQDRLRGHAGIGVDGDAGPASGSRACAASTSTCATTAPGAISLPRLVVQCVRLTPNPTMRSLSEISSSAAGEAKPPLMPTDQGLPANSPCPQIEVASSAPVRSANAISAASAPAEHRAATGENERALGARKRIRQPAHAVRIGMHRPRRRRQRERGDLAGKRRVLHVGRQAQHDRLAVAQRPDDGAQRILARGGRRVNALRDGPDRAHHLGLVDIEVRFHRAGRHVSGQHQQRRPALGRLADAGQRVGEPGPGMHADQRQLLGRLGVGVRHARGVAFVARGDELDAGLHQRVRDLEVGGAEQAEAPARAVVREVPGEHRRNRRVVLS